MSIWFKSCPVYNRFLESAKIGKFRHDWRRAAYRSGLKKINPSAVVINLAAADHLNQLMTNNGSSQAIKLVDRDLYLNGGKQAIKLKPMEARLLATLLRYPNQTVSRAILMREVWQTDFLGDTRTLDVHISWLRRKFEEDPAHPRRLVTVRGIGYCLRVNDEK